MRLEEEIKYREFMAGGPPSSKGPGSGNYEHKKSFISDTVHDALRKKGYAPMDTPSSSMATYRNDKEKTLFFIKDNGEWKHKKQFGENNKIGSGMDEASLHTHLTSDTQKANSRTISDKNGIEYKVVHSTLKDENGLGDKFDVYLPHTDTWVGGVTLSRKQGTDRNVEVADEYQHRGIASALYDYVEKALRIRLEPTEHLSPEAQGFWNKRSKL